MGGLNIALPQDLHKNLEQSIELSSPLALFNNDSFEIQQCEIEQQTKISLRQKADMQSELISSSSILVCRFVASVDQLLRVVPYPRTVRGTSCVASVCQVVS